MGDSVSGISGSSSGGLNIVNFGFAQRDCTCPPCPEGKPQTSIDNPVNSFTVVELAPTVGSPTTGPGTQNPNNYYNLGTSLPTGSSSGGCKECETTFQGRVTCAADSATTHATRDGNSVVLTSGQFQFTLPLAGIGSVGMAGWGFTVNYLAGNGVDFMLGSGMNFSQNTFVIEYTTGDVDLFQADNTKQHFTYDSGTNTYSSTDNNSGALLRKENAGGSNERFVLRNASGAVAVFYGFHTSITTPGRLLSYTDKNGNTQTMSWAALGTTVRLASVTDSYNRTITYRYFGSDKKFQLAQIEDFLGRKFNFQYDSSGRLTAIVTPAITKAAAGNEFPGGTAYVFQYDTDNSRPERRNDLIRIWYPNQTQRFLDTTLRVLDVTQVYSAGRLVPPRYTIAYGQDPTDTDHYGKVVKETIGDPDSSVGGSLSYVYTTNPSDLPPENLIDPGDPIVQRVVVTDRNGNQTIYDFNDDDMPVHVEVMATRQKNDLQASSYSTWTKYNAQNQPVLVIFPEGNSVEYVYETGNVTGIGFFARRRGLLLAETHKPDNALDINNPTRTGSNGQEELTRRYFYDPIYNQVCATIERRGNPIAPGTPPTYFTPQNGTGTGFPMPDDDDRSRYATITYFDYQKDTATTVKNDPDLQELLFPGDAGAAAKIQALINHVNVQMTATDGTGGIPAGFEMGLGDINGDGTGDGTGIDATHLGHVVKVVHPKVRLLNVNSGGGDPWVWEPQHRVELFTVNQRGQVTTHTDPEGNVTATVRYPDNDPEGDGLFIAAGLSDKQYGQTRAVHVDVDPFQVMSLIGATGDLIDFKTDVAPRSTRTNTPDVYQNLVTRYEGGGSSGGCSSCAYDPLGNPLAMTDPRGFTWRYERNEIGEVFRTTSPQPYEFKVETYFDANRNVIRTDTEDRVVQFKSNDPASADYAKFVPTGSGSTANVPMTAGPGGAIRPGWFTNLFAYNLLDNKVEDDIDATSSSAASPVSLVTRYEYDPNQNLIKITKPEGNTVEYDYDERDIRFATRVGYDASNPDAVIPGSVSVSVYDRNGNLIESIGPAQRGGAGTSRTVVISDAFSTGEPLTHTGDWSLENTYDGFNRVISAKDAVGNVAEFSHDPDGRVVQSIARGPVGGETPDNRGGSANVILARGFGRFDEAGRGYESQQDVFIGEGTVLDRAITQIGGGLAANSTVNDHTATFALTDTVGSDEVGLGPVDGSYVLARTVFDRASRTVVSAQDNAAKTTVAYDGASRAVSVTDALGNTVESQYDANGNVIRTTSTEKCTITAPTVADEVFESASWYDALNRAVVSAVQGADAVLDLDPLAAAALGGSSNTLFTFAGCDSRGNITVAIDPKGNTALTQYDGAGRAFKSIQHLRKDGQGTSGPADNQTLLPGTAGAIVTTSVYDGNSRVTQLVDDRGAVTAYAYDTLDRQVTMTFPDSSTRQSEYNAASNVVVFTDENGSVFDSTFDPLGRRTTCAVTPAAGIGGTTDQAFEYDGLSRLTLSTDTAGGMDADAAFAFDSLGRAVEETQTYLGNTRTVTHEEWTSLAATGFTFPQGRQLDNVFDSLYRRKEVLEAGGSSIAAWDFFGRSRVAEVELGNGLICTFMNNARTHSAVQPGVSNPAWGDRESDRLGYDGSGRMITKRYLAGGINGTTKAYNDPESVVGFTTSFDLASNKLYERHLHAESRSHLYQPFVNGEPAGGYDSLDRLRQYQRGILATGGGSVATPISLPNTDESRTYDLDGLGNWKQTKYEPVGGSLTTEQRQHNFLNQISKTKTGSTLVGFEYDKNGNLLNDGVRKYEYDAFNRLLKVFKDPNGTPTIIGTYSYDAGGRRIRKIVANGGLSATIPNGTTDFAYTGWRCVEERNGSDAPTKQYVWGTYIDELLQQKNLTALNDFSANVELYPLQDLLYRTTGLADSAGVVREAYDCDAYGNTLIFRDAGTPPAAINFDDADTQVEVPTCDCIFTGQRLDADTSLYCYRTRYFSPVTGRFCTRDSIGYVESMSLLEYVRSSPSNHVDALGYGTAPAIPAVLAAGGYTAEEIVFLTGISLAAARELVKARDRARPIPIPIPVPQPTGPSIDPSAAAAAAAAATAAAAAAAAAGTMATSGSSGNGQDLARLLRKIRDHLDKLSETIKNLCPCPCWANVLAMEGHTAEIYGGWGKTSKFKNHLEAALDIFEDFKIYSKAGSANPMGIAIDLHRQKINRFNQAHGLPPAQGGVDHLTETRERCNGFEKAHSRLRKCKDSPNCAPWQRVVLNLLWIRGGAVLKDCAKIV